MYSMRRSCRSSKTSSLSGIGPTNMPHQDFAIFSRIIDVSGPEVNQDIFRQGAPSHTAVRIVARMAAVSLGWTPV